MIESTPFDIDDEEAMISLKLNDAFEKVSFSIPVPAEGQFRVILKKLTDPSFQMLESTLPVLIKSPYVFSADFLRKFYLAAIPVVAVAAIVGGGVWYSSSHVSSTVSSEAGSSVKLATSAQVPTIEMIDLATNDFNTESLNESEEAKSGDDQSMLVSSNDIINGYNYDKNEF